MFNEYAQRIASRLFELQPSLKAYLEEPCSEEAGELWIIVPCPHSDQRLAIDTGPHGLIISIAGMHWHGFDLCDDPDTATPEQEAEACDWLVREILTDKLGVLDKYENGQWVGCSTLHPSDAARVEAGRTGWITFWSKPRVLVEAPGEDGGPPPSANPEPRSGGLEKLGP